MRCPFCGDEDTQVKDSRPTEDKMAIRRRRFCLNCQARFTTFERVQLRELEVIKRNGERRIFDRNKIFNSINIAVRKRSISEEQIETIVNNIVHSLELLNESEVTTIVIGEIIMKKLLKIDQVAYIRFASVYKEFHKASDFGEFIKNIVVDD